MHILHFLTAMFGSLALLGLIATGFLMMFAPMRAWQLLKNLGVAVLLFVVGSMLASWLCSGYFR